MSTRTRRAPLTLGAAEAGWVQRWARRALHAWLQQLEHGKVELVDGDDRRVYGGCSDVDLQCRLQVRDARTYSAFVFGGSIGAGESYAAGFWDIDDLPALIRIMLLNRELYFQAAEGRGGVRHLLERAIHTWKRNSRTGSRQNISAHYDLGNEFFRTFLDPTMTYSSGVFLGDETGDADGGLERAQRRKLDLLCRKLELGPDDELLEIGAGWGSMALHAAQNYGCRVTTTTISARQRDEAMQRIAAAGLSDRIEVLFHDYRDLPQVLHRRFSRLVSVEMIEAVGHRYLDRFFEVCSRMLRPDGVMALQAITITDRDYDEHVRTVDFIKRHIFPGGCLTSVTAMQRSMTRGTDLQTMDLQDLTSSYARTLALWRERFDRSTERLEQLGYDDRLRRLWDFYFGYCEGGFAERYIGVVQTVLAKPLYRRGRPVPQT